ncbi:MAG TPA: serine hydrolase domain-containing protein [Thermoanaerobaculia bacterium]|nr:serine hydrolase domain-containing protein [Thermoanaerobaculia bacterium]
MKTRLTLLVALSLLLAHGLPAEAARRRPVARPLPQVALPVAMADALAAEAIASGTPGLSIAIGHGQTRFAKGYGRTGGANTPAVTADTIFQIASLTKQFTAAAILALEEDGLLDVTDSVSEWIPELDLGARTVTLHHLLTHTSGLRTETEFLLDPYTPVSQADMIRLIATRGFATEPGAAEAYNNAGYWLLGVVIERASGMSYASFLEQRFFIPLAMTRTAYCGTGPAVPVPTGSFEILGRASATPPVHMSIAAAAGALCSSPADLVTWSRALASGEVISEASYQKMITRARLNNGTLLYYGYGLGLGTTDGIFVTSHNGMIPGFGAYLIHVPSKQITVAVLANALSVTHNWARDIARELLDAMLAEE